MYRLLERNGEVRERREGLAHPPYERPELLAERPNEVWSWDITKLKGPAKWTYYYLYVILDVFSRYAVGWTVQPRESAALAKARPAQAAEQKAIKPKTLTVHADRGSSMTSKPVASPLADLGVTKSHNRPYSSTDSPYSEAQFKTLKYRPGFPARLWLDRCGQRVLPLFLRLVQPSAPPLGNRPDEPRHRPPRPRRAGPRRPSRGSGRGLRGQARAVRPPAAAAAGATERGLDQQARPARHPGANPGQWIGRGPLTEARRTAHRAPDFTGRPSGAAKQRLRPRGGCSLNSLTKLSQTT